MSMVGANLFAISGVAGRMPIPNKFAPAALTNKTNHW